MMGRGILIFAFPSFMLWIQAQNVEDLHKTVASDRAKVEAAVDHMKNLATNYRRAVQNRTHAQTFALNLVEEARSQAADAARKGKKQAMGDFTEALSTLNKASPTENWEGAEKDARQKSENLRKLEEDEQKDASERLRTKRNAQKDEVRRSYQGAHEAVRNLLKDRNRLENAQRHAGESERVYEREEHMNEHFAEHNQDEAEHQREQAEGAIQHIFGRAEDKLMDQSKKELEAASRARTQAVQQAVASLRQAAKAAKAQKASVQDAIDLIEQPTQLLEDKKGTDSSTGSLASALKSMESTALNLRKADGKRTSTEQRTDEAKAQTEKQAQNLVDSDKFNLESAMSKMRNVAMEYRRAATNKSHAQAFAINLVEEAQTRAANNAKHNSRQAMNDFNQALSTLKGTSGNWKDAEKAARQKSQNLRNQQEEEQKDARQLLRNKREAQKDDVHRSYREARQTVRNMLKDRKSLMEAQRRAGEKESVYEGDDDRNEHFAERYADKVEHEKERAEGAIEHIFERAEDHLMDQGRKNLDAASHARQQAVQQAVDTLSKAQKAAHQSHTMEKGTSMQDAIELLATPSASLGTEQEAQNIVTSDKNKLMTAMTNMENVALSFRRAARNDRQTQAMAINLAEEAQSQAADDAKQEQGHAMNDFSTALSTLKSAPPTANWTALERSARQKSQNLDKLEEVQQRNAKEKLRSKRNAQKDEVRRSYRETRQAVRNLLNDRKNLMDAQRRAGQSENTYEREDDRNQDFAERYEDRAENQKEQADQAIETIFERAEDRLLDKGISQMEAASHARSKAVQEATDTLRKEAKVTHALRQAVQDAVENTLREEAEKETSVVLFGYSIDSSVCLFAAASLGLAVLVTMRMYAKPAPVAKPLLG